MNQVVKYFSGEKSESLVFFGIGIIGLVLALFFLFSFKTSFWKGVALPFILVSILEIIVGVTLIYRTPKDIARVGQYMNNQTIMIEQDEIPRMEKVMQNFVIFRYVEIALIILGMVLMYGFRNQLFWNGLGLGLFIQSGIVLILDFFAERRGEIYLEFLREFIR